MAEESSSSPGESSSSGIPTPELLTYVKLEKTLVLDTDQDEAYVFNGLEAYLLTIRAFDEDDNPVSVFVYQREVIDEEEESTADGYERAFFSNVASSNDLEELPQGIPSDQNQILFRHHTVQLICRSTSEAEFIWTEINKDLTALINHHKILLERLPSAPHETVVIS